MIKFFDSPETEKLKKLISDKKAYLRKLNDNKFAYQQIQKEIMFLEKDILPIVLNNTSVVHSEFVKYAVKAFDLALIHRCNSLLIYHPIELQYNEQPIVGICNMMANKPFRTPGATEVYIDSMDGSGVKPMPLNLNAFM